MIDDLDEIVEERLESNFPQWYQELRPILFKYEIRRMAVDAGFDENQRAHAVLVAQKLRWELGGVKTPTIAAVALKLMGVQESIILDITGTTKTTLNRWYNKVKHN